jgi:hypothetical protein
MRQRGTGITTTAVSQVRFMLVEFDLLVVVHERIAECVAQRLEPRIVVTPLREPVAGRDSFSDPALGGFQLKC